MMMLQVILSSFVSYLLPFKLRGPRMVAWVTCMVAPLQVLNNQFAAWAYGVRYQLGFTGQVIYLEHRLNDQFDPTLRRIYIDDPSGQAAVPLFVYNKAELQNDMILYNKAANKPPRYIDNKQPAGSSDFVVFVPSAVFGTLIEPVMRAVIDRYKIAGVHYTFQTI